ncbi:MAG: type II toxin-antitoxin system HicA family toxin [Nanoarchaeota archaeon]
MFKLPTNISGLEIIKALKKLGYEVDHQTGSHIILRQNTYPFRRLTVPNHKPVAQGTLRAIIREAGLSRNEFLNLL